MTCDLYLLVSSDYAIRLDTGQVIGAFTSSILVTFSPYLVVLNPAIRGSPPLECLITNFRNKKEYSKDKMDIPETNSNIKTTLSETCTVASMALGRVTSLELI